MTTTLPLPSSHACPDQLNAAIHAVYQSVQEGEPWRTCLEALVAYFQVTSASIIVRPSSPGDLGYLISAPTGGEVWERAYQTKWYQYDPFSELPPDRVVRMSDLVSDEEWYSSIYFRDFFQFAMPIGGSHALGVNIVTRAGTVSRLRLFRYPQLPAFTEEDKRQLALFVPHIRQAMTLSAQLHRNTAEREIYEEGLDRLKIGVLILDETGQLLRANPIACHLLNGGDGVRLVDRQLEGHTPADTRELRRSIASAQGDSAAVAALSLSRPAGKRKLAAVIRSIAPLEESEARHQPALAVFLRDPDAQATPALDIARQLFNFTPAEANLAIELVNGLSLDEAASKLAVSLNTVRAHLRAIFSKAGVTRQSELVRVILNGVLGCSSNGN